MLSPIVGRLRGKTCTISVSCRLGLYFQTRDRLARSIDQRFPLSGTAGYYMVNCSLPDILLTWLRAVQQVIICMYCSTYRIGESGGGKPTFALAVAR